MKHPARSYAIERYHPALKKPWGSFVRASENGTVLFMRDCMEYHCDRYRDHSLVMRRSGEIVALSPANHVGSEVYSHQRLTFGGVVSESMTTPFMLELCDGLITYLRR